MTEETKKEELPVYRTPNGLGKIIHMAAWGILFGIPFFFTGDETETVTIESYMRFVIVPISFMFVFYVNYFSWFRSIFLPAVCLNSLWPMFC